MGIADESIRRPNVLGGGHQHHYKKEGDCGRKKESQKKEDAAKEFNNAGHKSEKHRCEIYAEVLRGHAYLHPGIGAAKHLGIAVQDKHDTESDTQDQEANVTIFALFSRSNHR